MAVDRSVLEFWPLVEKSNHLRVPCAELLDKLGVEPSEAAHADDDDVFDWPAHDIGLASVPQTAADTSEAASRDQATSENEEMEKWNRPRCLLHTGEGKQERTRNGNRDDASFGDLYRVAGGEVPRHR